MPRTENRIEFGRLATQDIPEISLFLNQVYSLPEYFGIIGAPFFDEDYLSWLYGGPNQHKTILSGARIDGRLVAYQAFLYREYAWERTMKAYLETHAAISPSIDPRKRLECVLRLSQQFPIFHERSKFHDANCDMVIAFTDETKKTGSFLDRYLKKEYQLERTVFSILEFFLVIPNRLAAFLQQHAENLVLYCVRDATSRDIPTLTRLFNEPASGGELKLVMGKEELEYHLFGAKGHRTTVLEKGGSIKGFINYYPMRAIRNMKTSSYLVIEFLYYEYYCPEFLALLLNAAVQHARSLGIRTISLENPTYLEKRDFKDVGLIPALRKMLLSVAERDKILPPAGIYRGDIK
jgi:hypothetical protein